jgi:preprotein translocase subunit SecY
MPLWLWDFFAYWGIASAVCCFIVLAICARLYQLNQLFEDTYL